MELKFDLVNNFERVADTCQESEVGKHLPHALYVHLQYLFHLDPLLQDYEQLARNILGELPRATLIKFSTREAKISYLDYPDFDLNPHPALSQSTLVDLIEGTSKVRNYCHSDNPPILHRKETFITPDYPQYDHFAYLTLVEEKLGLLDNSRYIGTQREWLQLLRDRHLTFSGHALVCPLGARAHQIAIDRHRAAIVRRRLSRPVRIALETGLFPPRATFFDYGCGHGGDIERMAELGYEASGWDPHFRPHEPLQEADIVNLGYVINAIEDLGQRREALLKAWNLTLQVLIVSAQVLIDNRDRGFLVYGDGIVTGRNTFQKYYGQEELKTYIEQVLQAEAIAIGLGVYLVFRDRHLADSLLSSRFHSRVKAPRVLSPLKKFADYQELLSGLMDFYTERGRLPVRGEFPQEAAIAQEFGSYRRAFKVILQVTKQEEWDAIADRRRQEILIYLALSRFSQRPTLRKLPPQLKADIKALFDNYQAACFLADEMLINLRDLKLIKTICAESKLGIMGEKSFLVHLRALDSLPSLLRLYEGCASRTIGRMEGANLIRFYFTVPKIAYLYYPNFDRETHPRLQTSMSIDLRDLQVQYRDFQEGDGAPILKEKDRLA